MRSFKYSKGISALANHLRNEHNIADKNNLKCPSHVVSPTEISTQTQAPKHQKTLIEYCEDNEKTFHSGHKNFVEYPLSKAVTSFEKNTVQIYEFRFFNS